MTLVANEAEFTSSNLVLTSPLPGAPGTPSGARVSGAVFRQLHIPALGIWSDWSNPILLAEYTWTTASFEARAVDLWTETTSMFGVAPTSGGASIDLVANGQFTRARAGS